MKISKILRLPLDFIITVLVIVLLIVFAFLPFKVASDIGGFVARKLGRLFKASQAAKRNLERLKDHFPVAQHQKIIDGMWDNLGRMFAEFARYTICPYSTMNRYAKLDKSVRKIPKNSIMVSGHFGNFEVPAPFSRVLGLDISLVYRPANNIFFDFLLCKLRLINAKGLIPKGNIAIKQMMRVLSEGKIIGMLIDQKTSQGDTLKFFGRDAKTTTLAPKLAQKYQVPLHLLIFRRHDRYYISVESVEIKFSSEESAVAIMQRVNDELEKFVQLYPDQWFWVHKRWG